jgi:hypothetical protein
MTRIRLAVAAVVVALAAACSADPPAPAPEPATTTAAPTSTAAPTTAAAPATVAADPGPVTHPTVWLCRPGLPANPCEGGLDATVAGTGAVETFTPAADPPVDCFYVYPTVSTATARNAPLKAAAAEVATVRAQAARFAGVCRLFAPVYRQVTVRGLATGGLTDPKARALAHGDVVSAWHDYLRLNPGRRFVLLGHSQGTFELTQLIQEEVDGNPALVARLVSALLIGGYVAVDPGKDTGTFRNIPACRTAGQRGCVVAYNSFAGTPPANTIFGRVGSGQQVLCVNPAGLAGGRAPLRTYVPGPRTGFVAYTGGQVTGQCRTAGGVTWLDVRGTTAQARAVLTAASNQPAWGLHRADVNLSEGDLIALVKTQSG